MTSERAPPTVALAEAQSRRRGRPPALRGGGVSKADLDFDFPDY
jgi:hypothetical protein